jgi:hypothetical protein
MGVNIESMFLVFATDNGLKGLLFLSYRSQSNFPSGARSALLMGVALEAMVEYLQSSIGSKNFIFWILSFFLASKSSLYYLTLFCIGCTASAPDGSSPEAMVGCLQPIRGSKYYYSGPMLTKLSSKLFF